MLLVGQVCRLGPRTSFLLLFLPGHYHDLILLLFLPGHQYDVIYPIIIRVDCQVAADFSRNTETESQSDCEIVCCKGHFASAFIHSSLLSTYSVQKIDFLIGSLYRSAQVETRNRWVRDLIEHKLEPFFGKHTSFNRNIITDATIIKMIFAMVRTREAKPPTA